MLTGIKKLHRSYNYNFQYGLFLKNNIFRKLKEKIYIKYEEM